MVNSILGCQSDDPEYHLRRGRYYRITTDKHWRTDGFRECDGQAGGVAQIYHPEDAQAIREIGWYS